MNIADFHRRFVEEAPDGLLAVDRDGVIRCWNAGCERIFGYASGEAIGASLDMIIPERLRARHWQGFGETMRTGVTRYGAGELLSVPAHRKDQTFCRILDHSVPEHGRDHCWRQCHARGAASSPVAWRGSSGCRPRRSPACVRWHGGLRSVSS